MRHIRKSTAAAIVGVGALILLATPSWAEGAPNSATAGAAVQLAHMGQGRGAQRMGQPCPMGMPGPGMMAPGMGGPGTMGPGMMGQGYGPGPGYGMGPGMMGPGQGGQGMMGPGFGRDPGLGDKVVPSKDLTPADVRHFLEHRLEMHGNKRLKVGEVREADQDKIIADITTVEGSLVQRLEVDRHTGQMQHVE